MSECYWLKFADDPARQCKNPGTAYRIPVGNNTDNWTWCEAHVGTRRDDSRSTAQNKPEQP